MNRISYEGSEEFFNGLAKSRIEYLSLASNPLLDQGVELLSLSLHENKNLKFLDLFDVEFGDEGAIQLSYALIKNNTLRMLYIANTNISNAVEGNFLKSVELSKSLTIFKYHKVDYIKNFKISKNTYKTENRLDPILTMIEEYYQIVDYFNKDDESLNQFSHR